MISAANLSDAVAPSTSNNISDLMMTGLDPSLLNFRLMNDSTQQKNVPLDWMSQVLSDPMSIEWSGEQYDDNGALKLGFEDDDDMNVGLDLDFGDDDGMNVGLDLDFGDDDGMNVGLDLDFGDDNDSRIQNEREQSVTGSIGDDLVECVMGSPTLIGSQRQRNPQASLSSSVVRNTSLDAKKEKDFEYQSLKVKKRKIIQADEETVIPIAQLRQQQLDRSAILEPVSSLSRDSMLLRLMNMQNSGDFVSNIMRHERAKNWAPEIRDLLSLEVVRIAGELKRKYDKVIVNEEDRLSQLEMPEEGFSDDDIALGEQSVLNSPMRDHRGAASLGTQSAAHLLRDRFGFSADGSQQDELSVLFQDMLWETTTSKSEATKMFLDVLILATKDAVTVDQPGSQLGGPIRIQGKRGLWGA